LSVNCVNFKTYAILNDSIFCISYVLYLLLIANITFVLQEKAILTQVLPSLSRTPSDEDMLSTDPEADSPAGSVDDLRPDVPSPSPRQARAQSLQYSKSSPLLEAFRPSGMYSLAMC